MNFVGKSAGAQYGARRIDDADEGSDGNAGPSSSSLLERYRRTSTAKAIPADYGRLTQAGNDDERAEQGRSAPAVALATSPTQAKRRPVATVRRGVRSPRAAPRQLPDRNTGGSSLTAHVDASESADDEATSGQEEEVAERSNARNDGWRRADRLLAGSRMSLDDLYREQHIIENDLRSSLSTLLMLRPGSSGAQPLPAFLRDPSPDTSSAFTGIDHSARDLMSLAMSTSPSSVLTALPSHRRQSPAAAATQTRHDSPTRPLTPASSAGEWQHLSSASSFEHLSDRGVASSTEDELGFDDRAEHTTILSSRSRTGPTAVHRTASPGGSTSRSALDSHGDTYREPEHFTAELQIAAVGPSGEQHDMQMHDIPDRSLPSPHVPASMTASTQFALSSNDSPLSRDLTSSQELDDQLRATQTPRKRDGDAQDASDDDSQTRSPSPATDMRRKKAAALQRAAQSAQYEPQQYVDDKAHNADPEAGLPGDASPESWSAWIRRQLRRMTFGVGLLGIGYLVAMGLGFVQRPLIMRKGMSARDNHILLNRISLQLTPFE